MSAPITRDTGQSSAEYRHGNGPSSAELPRVHYTELPIDKSNNPTAEAWNTYCREVGRLLSEGYEGKFALLNGKEIVGLYDSFETAREVGLKRFLLDPFLVQEVRTWEPYLRVRGLNFPWPTRLSR